jgi:hypothetical protein
LAVCSSRGHCVEKFITYNGYGRRDAHGKIPIGVLKKPLAVIFDSFFREIQIVVLHSESMSLSESIWIMQS